MVATVEICEGNGAAETVTHNISNINWGNTEAVNLVPTSFPITVGSNGYLKNVRVHVTGAPSNSVSNIRIWKSAGAYVTGEGVQSNTHTTQANYDTYKAITYTQGTTVTYTAYAIAEVEPGSANMGIGGSLVGTITTTGYSDYWRHQVQSTVSTPPGNGNQKTISFKYDEQ